MATFRSTRPGNVFDPDVWELIPDEPPKRATMITRIRRWVGRVIYLFKH